MRIPATLSGVPTSPVAGSEPPRGTTVVAGLPDSALGTLGDIGRGLFEEGVRRFGERGRRTKKGVKSFAEEGPCPGLSSIFVPGVGCVNLTDVLPGGDPAVTGTVGLNGFGEDFGRPVAGLFGVGVTPRVDVQTVRRCPPGTALGKDGICYTGLSRNSPKRLHPMGLKPLLTGGDRMAIRTAGAAARKLERAKKSLRKTAKSLEKAC